jgi:hypothetical protein
MNQTNCPPGWATDQFLLHEQPLDTCGMSVSVFTSLVVIVMATQLVITVGQTHLWLRRERRKGNRDAIARREAMICGQRLPVVPALSGLTFLVLLVTWTLTGLNLVNSMNGGSNFITGVGFLLFAVINMLSLLKFVSLGYNIIGRGTANKLASQHLGTERQANLRKFDTMGKITMFIGISSMLGTFLSFCVFGLIFPNK